MTKGIIILIHLILFYCFSLGTLTGKWKLIQYKDLITGQIEYEPTEYKGFNVLTFDFQDNDSLGTFKGKTVSNDTYGEYIIMPNNKIKVKTFGGTKVNEPAWGHKFWKTIHQSTSYKINNDTLIIFYNNDNNCMIFSKRQ